MSAHYYDASFAAGYRNHYLNLNAETAADMIPETSAEVKAYLRGAHAAHIAHKYGISLVPRHMKYLYEASQITKEEARMLH